jgi:tRNA nucleotidyltransferase (CCA-adding enzyme)
MNITDIFLIQVLNKLVENHASPVLVGGCVRDYFLGLDVKDYDIEVYGLEKLEELEALLEEFGDVNHVGKSFGILKLSTTEMEYDFSFPRLENKTTLGHRGFDVVVDGSLTFEIATKRRDFTINSIGYDYKNKIYHDPFQGIKDIKHKLLKHIDDETFMEDALRVYRAVQFSARFDFALDTYTFKLCKKIVKTEEFKTLSKERIYEEYKKLFLKSKMPSVGLTLLNQLKIEKIDKNNIVIIDELSQEKLEDQDKLILIFSLLEELFLNISDDKKMLKKIANFRAFKVPKIYENKLQNIHTITKKMIVKFKILNNMPKPLFKGKDLIQMGYKPSEKFKSILDTLYKMQLDGKICLK